VSPELDPIRANFYQSQIGILLWCVELGRTDIITEVSMMCTHLCVPREGHLEDVFHVFVYMGLHHNARVVFDPTYPSVDIARGVLIGLIISLQVPSCTLVVHVVKERLPCCPFD
jgi:hypothetical protein